jgi:L-asparagine transporter-like permease
MNDNYIFWLDDPSVLYKNGNYIKILPEVGMSRVDQLNAVTRFCIYFIILLLLFRPDQASWYYCPLIIIIFIVILYNLYLYDPEGKKKRITVKAYYI